MDALNELRLYIGDRLARIQDMINQEFGLTGIRRLTLVARDPDNPEMYVVSTNEPDQDAIRTAAQLAAAPPATSTPDADAERDPQRLDWRDASIALENAGCIGKNRLEQVQELIAQRDAAVRRTRQLEDEREEREALLRAWRMLENGATRTAVIEAIANTLGINELPND